MELQLGKKKGQTLAFLKEKRLEIVWDFGMGAMLGHRLDKMKGDMLVLQKAFVKDVLLVFGLGGRLGL